MKFWYKIRLAVDCRRRSKLGLSQKPIDWLIDYVFLSSPSLPFFLPLLRRLVFKYSWDQVLCYGLWLQLWSGQALTLPLQCLQNSDNKWKQNRVGRVSKIIVLPTVNSMLSFLAMYIDYQINHAKKASSSFPDKEVKDQRR